MVAGPTVDLGLQAKRAGDEAAAAGAAVRLDRLAMAAAGVPERVGDPGGPLGQLLALERAQIETERGRLDERSDAAAWAEVAQGWTGLGRPYVALQARWRMAEAANDAGERQTAAEVLRRAHAEAVALGAVPLAGRMETLARNMRLRLDSKAWSSPDADAARADFGLTKREREVLSLVAIGRTNKQVAEELFISESTAGVHVSNILGKLGVSSRTEAASVALSQGLVEI